MLSTHQPIPTESGQPLVWNRTKNYLYVWYVMTSRLITPYCRLPVKKTKVGSWDFAQLQLGSVGVEIVVQDQLEVQKQGANQRAPPDYTIQRVHLRVQLSLFTV